MKRLLLIICALILLTGCNKESRIMKKGPHEIAADYFEALYNERDLEKMMALSSQRNKELIEHYGNASSVARYMYNMSFDQVQVSAERPTGIVYMNRNNTVRIQVAFTGFNGTSRVDELREVVMIEEAGEWRLERVLDSPYM
ncbi:MAG: putative lipoprotein [Idiomarinaceae bacterium HL-53]|nr:MAG: putative lipoprotein [Idiomarinaceae bacterium HL-53]CUS49087.1 hypothetical protein Ga0003345_2074 [Idiomarinaceae bacterium HL-53]